MSKEVNKRTTGDKKKTKRATKPTLKSSKQFDSIALLVAIESGTDGLSLSELKGALDKDQNIDSDLLISIIGDHKIDQNILMTLAQDDNIDPTLLSKILDKQFGIDKPLYPNNPTKFHILFGAIASNSDIDYSALVNTIGSDGEIDQKLLTEVLTGHKLDDLIVTQIMTYTDDQAVRLALAYSQNLPGFSKSKSKSGDDSKNDESTSDSKPDIDPLMLMSLMSNSKSNPLLIKSLMTNDISDPMLLMSLMSSGNIDPALLMALTMNNKSDDKSSNKESKTDKRSYRMTILDSLSPEIKTRLIEDGVLQSRDTPTSVLAKLLECEQAGVHEKTDEVYKEIVDTYGPGRMITKSDERVIFSMLGYLHGYLQASFPDDIPVSYGQTPSRFITFERTVDVIDFIGSVFNLIYTPENINRYPVKTEDAAISILRAVEMIDIPEITNDVDRIITLTREFVGSLPRLEK